MNHSTLDTLRQYEANAREDEARARARNDVTTACYYEGKAAAYGVAIEMVESLIASLDDAVAWANR